MAEYVSFTVTYEDPFYSPHILLWNSCLWNCLLSLLSCRPSVLFSMQIWSIHNILRYFSTLNTPENPSFSLSSSSRLIPCSQTSRNRSTLVVYLILSRHKVKMLLLPIWCQDKWYSPRFRIEDPSAKPFWVASLRSSFLWLHVPSVSVTPHHQTTNWAIANMDNSNVSRILSVIRSKRPTKQLISLLRTSQKHSLD